ncbi:MAG: DUF554 domain-containing protein [Turicibacter sp.]
MLGTWINFFAILIGGTIGLFIKNGVPEKLNKSIMNALALGVMYVGITSLSTESNPLLIIVSLAVGTLVGEWIDLDEGISRLAVRLETRLNKNGGQHNVAQGFLASVLLFCVGAMAILGAIEGSLQGTHSILMTKSVLDGVTSIIFAAAMGLGVVLSAFFVLFYQGSLVLLAGVLSPIFTDAALQDIGVLGGIMIIGLGLNVLGVTKIKVANMLPALIIPILYHLMF